MGRTSIYLSYQESCKLLNHNPVLVASLFHCKCEVFFIEVILDGLFGETKYTIHIEFKGESHMSIYLYGFSMHQIFKWKLPT